MPGVFLMELDLLQKESRYSCTPLLGLEIILKRVTGPNHESCFLVVHNTFEITSC